VVPAFFLSFFGAFCAFACILFFFRPLVRMLLSYLMELLMSEKYSENVWETVTATTRTSPNKIIENSLRAQSGQVLERPFGSPRKFLHFDVEAGYSVADWGDGVWGGGHLGLLSEADRHRRRLPVRRRAVVPSCSLRCIYGFSRRAWSSGRIFRRGKSSKPDNGLRRYWSGGASGSA